MDFQQGVVTLGAVALGWLTNDRSANSKIKKEHALRVFEIKVNVYAKWATSLDWQFARHVAGGSSAGLSASDHRPQIDYFENSVDEKRFLLWETDPATRELIAAIRSTWPAHGSQELYELYIEQSADPDFDFRPFREALDAITDRVRQSRPQ